MPSTRGSSPEGPLDPTLAVRPALRFAELAHGVLESADGRVDRALEQLDLVVVLDQSQLRQRRRQFGVGVRRLVGVGLARDPAREQLVDTGVVVSENANCRVLDPLERRLEFVEWRASDAEQEFGFEPQSRTDPQLAVAAIGEEGLGRPVHPRCQVERDVVAGRGGLEDEHGVGLEGAGEPVEVGPGPERVVGVVGPDLEVAGRHDDPRTGEPFGHGLAAAGRVGSGLGSLGHLRGRCRPVTAHELDERVRRGGIVGDRSRIALGEFGRFDNLVVSHLQRVRPPQRFEARRRRTYRAAGRITPLG